MHRDRFTPYSCTFSGNVPRELWMDYDEADPTDLEDEDDSPDASEDGTDSSPEQHPSCFERLFVGVMGDLRTMDRGRMVTGRLG
ncbi:MAG: hypothetical protein O3A14_03810 [Cyanobacteria bacterium]|nr:hypothetical protein [Cyanobacteriota bacterium]